MLIALRHISDLLDPDANLNITDSPCLAAIEKTLKDRYGINSAGDFESYKIYSGLENKNAPYAYAYQKNYLGDAYDDANYPIDLTKYGMQLVNDTINGYVGMLENLSDILPDGIDLDVDAILQSLARVEGPNGEKLSLDYLVNILKDIYVKLAKDPVGTIANLLPLLAVLLDEVLVPLLFNQIEMLMQKTAKVLTHHC